MTSLFCASKRKKSGKDRSFDLKTGFNVAKEIQGLFKKWLTLEKDITRKEIKVETGHHSKKLVPCQNDRDKLQQQLQDDILFLEKVLEHNYPSQLDRKDNKRHTTGDIGKTKSESYHKHHEVGRNFEVYEDEIEGHQIKRQKHNEDGRPKERPMESGQVHYPAAQTEQNKLDALEKECARLKKDLDESENEKAALKISHKETIGVLKKELRDLKERTKEHEHVQRQAASTEQNENDIVKEECKKLTLDMSSFEKKEKELKTKCDELEADVASYKENWTKSEDAKTQLEIKITELQNKSKEGERETKTWKNQYNSLEEEKKRIEEEIKSLKEEKRRTEGNLKRLEAKNNELTNQLDSERKAKEDALLKLTIDKSSYEKIEKELRTKCNELEADIASYKENWTKSEDAKIQLEIKITHLEEEKKRSEGQLKRLEAKSNQLTTQLDNERKSKEDALLRLSSMASNKLRDNNPNIADLSDPYRPTKLSEQFSELYDNEWTDAFDELEKLLGEKEDKEIISYLRDFVLEIHSFCSDISSSKLKTIEEAFVKPSVPSEDTKIPTEMFKTIKDGIKSMAPDLLGHTRDHILGHLEEKYLNDPVVGCLQHQNVKRYIDKCTEICWYMSVQDPQLVLDGSKSPDEKFDSNKHREYTKKGPYEEFVVWPVLYLYRGGQMLSKGVAQGAKKEIIGQQ